MTPKNEYVNDKISERTQKASSVAMFDQSQSAIMKALKRIETLEDQALNNYQQKMIDQKLVQDQHVIRKVEELERLVAGKDIAGAMSRLDTVENLVVAFRQEQDQRGGQELKDMMSNLKSKYKFLEPAEEKKNSAVIT